MLTLKMIFKNGEKLKQYLVDQGLDFDRECLIRVYTPCLKKDEIPGLLTQIKQAVPLGRIIGSSGSGIIYNGVQYEDRTLVIVEQFKHTSISVHSYTFHGKTARQCAREVCEKIEDGTSLVHILMGDSYYDVYDFVECFNEFNSYTRLTGGIVGDILPEGIRGYVFTGEGIVEEGIVTGQLKGERLHVTSLVNIAHEAISPMYTVTGADGNYLTEIEGVPAVDWCLEQFGLQNLKEYNDWQRIAENDNFVRFPLVLEGHSGSSRFIKYDEEKGEISLYFSCIPVGSRFRIGYTNPDKCVKECFDICNTLTREPVESLFCYTCLFRKLYLENSAEWELRPFRNYGICGVFMMGEIGYLDGRNEFLNGTCSMIGAAEEDSYVQIDYNVFDSLYKIKDDKEQLLTFVLKRQSEAMGRENQRLLSKLLSHQKLTQKSLYFDSHTGLPNTLGFSRDNLIYNFERMCITQIENAELLITRLGQTGYYKFLRTVIRKVRKYVRSLEYSSQLFFYILNDRTFFMTARDSVSENAFRQIVAALYEKYKFVQIEGQNDILVNRFIQVQNQEDLLKSGLQALQNYKNTHTHFLICDNDIIQNKDLDKEMEILNVLNNAVEKHWVVPFFQGIYDSHLNKIIKYEALMRIIDDDGVIYIPGDFMEISKKYHLYTDLSRQMIAQVFNLFNGRKEEVSVNISMIDITTPYMRDFIFRSIHKLKNPQNFVFEILEDENMSNMKELMEFINMAREVGIRIAVDDFGSGYSNFMEIAHLNPDFIKIDSSIIRNVDKDKLSRKVMENIVFLGHQLDAALVAEYVENEQIQKRITELGVYLSQGYYFSKPLPFDELELAD